MDADITGPSIPRLLNISHKKATANELGIIPVTTSNGIKVMSLNLLMEDEDQPVIWRGPLIAGVVEQFWTDVQWGRFGLSYYRYATRNRRCGSNCNAVYSYIRIGHGICAPRFGFHDSFKVHKYG